MKKGLGDRRGVGGGSEQSKGTGGKLEMRWSESMEGQQERDWDMVFCT
jgi:hypothetical protein